MNSPYQEEILEQEYSRPIEKCYKDSAELKRQINTYKVICTLLLKTN